METEDEGDHGEKKQGKNQNQNKKNKKRKKTGSVAGYYRRSNSKKKQNKNTDDEASIYESEIGGNDSEYDVTEDLPPVKVNKNKLEISGTKRKTRSNSQLNSGKKKIIYIYAPPKKIFFNKNR